MKNMKSMDLITEAKSLICSSLLVAKLHHRPLADLHPPLVVRYGSFRLAFSQTHHHFSFLQEEFLSSTHISSSKSVETAETLLYFH